ncbi:plasmid mobilization protein [Arcobacter defluvii]|uniref:Plasmid mobilization relaxosome protein MobC n=1 Tax=Arcobacter defluvii TaxID=873191 RepID=A0AAE7BE83_9BACT|nr:plasmid mobilization relaxosome protein MobC [Arcobacter defluvii]QKF77473.1 hypothetical protein ADFLV_1448 [Arcobacter defluvii]RXI32069.1 hypothetical protein CP964_08800 [Arcobacter defluvii]
MKKEELFKFRISKELKDLLESKSQYVNMSASEFLRQFISSSNINVKINNKKDLKELIWNINKIGVNINQLAHSLNYSIQMEKLDSYNYKNLINKLIIIENQLDSILEKEF